MKNMLCELKNPECIIDYMISKHQAPELIIEYMKENQLPLTSRLSPWHNTILHKAAFSGHIELIMHLHKLNFNLNIKDDLGQTPLFVCNNLNTVKCLIECGADMNIVDDRYVTAICNYIEWDQQDIVDYLKEIGINTNNLSHWI